MASRQESRLRENLSGEISGASASLWGSREWRKKKELWWGMFLFLDWIIMKVAYGSDCSDQIQNNLADRDQLRAFGSWDQRCLDNPGVRGRQSLVWTDSSPLGRDRWRIREYSQIRKDQPRDPQKLIEASSNQHSVFADYTLNGKGVWKWDFHIEPGLHDK